jgi:hypothetical protein
VTDLPEDPTVEVPPPGPWLRDAGEPQAKWALDGEVTGPDFGRLAESDGDWSGGDRSPRQSMLETVLNRLDRPEIVIGAAFIAGVVLATVVKRLAR